MDTDVTLLIALAAGALSFLSPCVLPLVPGYICFIAGARLEDIAPSTQKTQSSQITTSQVQTTRAKTSVSRGRIMLAASLFVLGFSTVFILLGASASSISFLMLQYQDILAQIAGAVIIVFGLHTFGVLRIGFLNRDTRYHQSERPLSVYGAYTVGLAFGFGWTPCIGPILAAVLSVAAQQQNLSEGILLLSIYAAGLGIPFLIAAYATDHFMGFLSRFRAHMKTVERVTGGLLVTTGVLIITGGLEWLGFWLIEHFPVLGQIG